MLNNHIICNFNTLPSKFITKSQKPWRKLHKKFQGPILNDLDALTCDKYNYIIVFTLWDNNQSQIYMIYKLYIYIYNYLYIYSSSLSTLWSLSLDSRLSHWSHSHLSSNSQLTRQICNAYIYQLHNYSYLTKINT